MADAKADKTAATLRFAAGSLRCPCVPSKHDPETSSERMSRSNRKRRGPAWEVGSQHPLRLTLEAAREWFPHPHSDSSLGSGGRLQAAGAEVAADPFGGGRAFQKDGSPASRPHEPSLASRAGAHRRPLVKGQAVTSLGVWPAVTVAAPGPDTATGGHRQMGVAVSQQGSACGR